MSDKQATEGVYLRGRYKAQRLKALRRDWLHKRFKEQRGVCAICGIRMQPLGDVPVHPTMQATLDHIVPLSKGGMDHWENTQAAHRKCNQEKGNQYER